VKVSFEACHCAGGGPVALPACSGATPSAVPRYLDAAHHRRELRLLG